MIKKTFLVLLLFCITHCGYTPVYNSKIDDDLKINVINYTGDNYLNQRLNNELKTYFDINDENTIKLDVQSEYEKRVISKDVTGKTTDFELIAKVTFKMSYQNKIETFSINESIKIKDKTDTFEQQKYEKIMRNNFAKSIKQKLLLKLMSIKESDD